MEIMIYRVKTFPFMRKRAFIRQAKTIQYAMHEKQKDYHSLRNVELTKHGNRKNREGWKWTYKCVSLSLIVCGFKLRVLQKALDCLRIQK